MPRPVVYPNVFGSLSGQVSMSLLDQNFNADGAILNDSASGWVNAAIDTGSVNSYIITLNPPASEYINGFCLAFIPLNTNTGPSSINVNNLGNIQILKADGSAIAPQSLLAGTVYTLICINSAMRVIAPQTNTIVGEVVAFASAAIPINWLACNGNAVSRSQYVALFSVIGTLFGAGDGSTTFTLPNLNNNSFVCGAVLGSAGGANSAVLLSANMPPHNHPITSTVSDPGHSHTYTYKNLETAGVGGQAGNSFLDLSQTQNTSFVATGVTVNSTSGFVGSGTPFSTMPKYVGLTYIIRAF